MAPKKTKPKQNLTKTNNLTPKQERFAKAYNGNATEAAEKAGYSHPGSQGQRLLKNVEIVKYIREREKERISLTIATREERQEFWSKVLKGDIGEKVQIGTNEDGTAILETIPAKMTDRLKASELLGRSEADFTDNQRLSGPDGKDINWTVEIVDPGGEK